MWLKYYIFLRMLPNDKKGGGQASAALTTFIVSAIWHGFYPGFFFFFFFAGLVDYQAKIAGQALYPLVANRVPEWFIFIVCYIWCYMMCGYMATSFYLLSFENFNKVYGSMYYILHIVLSSGIVLCLAIMPSKATKEQQKVEGKSKSD